MPTFIKAYTRDKRIRGYWEDEYYNHKTEGEDKNFLSVVGKLMYQRYDGAADFTGMNQKALFVNTTKKMLKVSELLLKKPEDRFTYLREFPDKDVLEFVLYNLLYPVKDTEFQYWKKKGLLYTSQNKKALPEFNTVALLFLKWLQLGPSRENGYTHEEFKRNLLLSPINKTFVITNVFMCVYDPNIVNVFYKKFNGNLLDTAMYYEAQIFDMEELKEEAIIHYTYDAGKLELLIDAYRFFFYLARFLNFDINGGVISNHTMFVLEAYEKLILVCLKSRMQSFIRYIEHYYNMI